MPVLTDIPAGTFISGSNAQQGVCLCLDETAYGSSVTREQDWYDAEPAGKRTKTGAYCITITSITNRQYAVFIHDTGWYQMLTRLPKNLWVDSLLREYSMFYLS